MKIKIITLLYFLLFASMPLFAGNGAEIIYRTDRDFQAVQFSSIASGKNIPGSMHAITRREFQSSILRQEPDRTEDGFTGSVHLELTPFVAWYDSPYDSRNELVPHKLIYLYNQIPDGVSFTAGAGLDNFFYAKIIYTASCSKKSVSDGTGILQPFSGEYYDSGDSPKEGYISFAGDHMSAVIGRLKGGIGNGIMGNLFQNSLAPYYDQISFSFFNRFVKYSYMIGWSSYYQTEEEIRYMDVDGGTTSGTDPGRPAADYRYEPLKMFAFHRLEFNLTDTLSFGLGEMTLTGGKFPDMNMINPLGIYHNIYESRYHSYYAGADVSWVPADRHFLYAEFLANEIYVPGESNTDPTATAVQIGYWYILPVQSDVKHRIALELTHVDGWTYSDLTPYLTMYQRQIQREITFDVPLGYSYGGDCQQFSFIYTAAQSGGMQINASASYLQKGEIGLELVNPGTDSAYMPYTKRDKYKGLPSGTVEHWFMCEASADIPVNELMSVRALGSYSYIANFGHRKGKKDQLVYISGGMTFHIF